MADKEKASLGLGKFLLIFWSLASLPLLGLVLLFYLVSNDYLGELPSFEELENPKSNLASEVYTADQMLLGKYYRENRTNVLYEEMSPFVPQALVATEDERFYDHSGIDFWALPRVVMGVLTGTTSKGGGSTITQQLAKMLFHDRPGSKLERVIQKFKEWVIATRLERQYTKEEIITMYLNKFDFINNAVGIKSAASVYFSKSPDSLNILESAMLVGMAKNPTLYNPVRKPDNALFRRNIVLGQMKRNELLTDQELDSLKQYEVALNFNRVDHKTGPAPYFREMLRLKLGEMFKAKDEATGEYIIQKPNGDPYNVYSDGLKIYTTIDSRMQQYAENAVASHLTNLQKDFFRDINKGKRPPFHNTLSKSEVDRIINTSIKRSSHYRILKGKECANCGRRGDFVSKITEDGKDYWLCSAADCEHKTHVVPADSIDIIFNTPQEFKVFSWEGEKDTMMSFVDYIKYNKSILQAGLMSMDPHTGFVKAWVGGVDYEHFAYDHVKQGKRQVGSTFKPFVYGLAIQEGMSPCYEVTNTLYTFYKGEYGLLKDWTPKNSDGEYGYEVSLKYALANSMNTITAWLLKRFSPKAVIAFARKAGIKSHIEPVPSLCLGIADLSVYEMVGAYSTFANKGVWTEPIFISRIEDSKGNVVIDFVPETREAMNEETAYVMLEMMKGIVDGVRGSHDGKVLGTGIRLRSQPSDSRPYTGISSKIAAKTGTTQNNSDGWFMGVTPDLVTGVWVGAEDRGVHFRTTYYGQGANTALPIWAYYMNSVYDDEKLNISQSDFEKPEKTLKIELDCNKFQSQNNGGFDPEDFNDK